jgi:hypothetical protein
MQSERAVQDRQVIADLRERLAAAEARCAEREQAARHMLECMIAADWKRNVIDCVDKWKWLNDQYTGE